MKKYLEQVKEKFYLEMVTAVLESNNGIRIRNQARWLYVGLLSSIWTCINQ